MVIVNYRYKQNYAKYILVHINVTIVEKIWLELYEILYGNRHMWGTTSKWSCDTKIF